ncbi:MAG: hypothetical protein WCH93_08450 [Actinomycetota bacterium]
MTNSNDTGLITCERFDDHVDELAIGMLDEPRRTQVLRHAGLCASCRAQLDELSGLADRILVLTPEVEPPAGFEQRVLERLKPAHTTAHGRRRLRPFGVVFVVAAVVAGLAAWGGLLVGQHRGNHTDQGAQDTPHQTLNVTHSGAITMGNGRRQGSVSLVSEPKPHVLVTLDVLNAAYVTSGEVYCELQTLGGRSVRVGSWNYGEVRAGVWTAGITADLLNAVSMRVVAMDGTVVATAVLA